MIITISDMWKNQQKMLDNDNQIKLSSLIGFLGSVDMCGSEGGWCTAPGTSMDGTAFAAFMGMNSSLDCSLPLGALEGDVSCSARTRLRIFGAHCAVFPPPTPPCMRDRETRKTSAQIFCISSRSLPFKHEFEYILKRKSGKQKLRESFFKKKNMRGHVNGGNARIQDGLWSTWP